MFQLIIAVLSIALIAIIVLMVMWFGGGAFTDSGERALFTRYLNEGQQIEGALKMYQADKGVAPSGTSESILGDLTTEQYLSTVPEGDWVVETTTIRRQLEGIDQCRRLNEFMGMDFAPLEALGDDSGCPPCRNPHAEDTSHEDFAAYERFKTWPGCKEDV